MRAAPKYVVPRATADLIEQAIARGEDHDQICARLDVDAFTVARVRVGMDAAVAGGGSFTDPILLARRRQTKRDRARRRRAAAKAGTR